MLSLRRLGDCSRSGRTFFEVLSKSGPVEVPAFRFFEGMAEHTHNATIEAKARDLCEPLLAAEGLELVDLELVREMGGWVLRLYIDRPGVGSTPDDAAPKAAVETPWTPPAPAAYEPPAPAARHDSGSHRQAGPRPVIWTPPSHFSIPGRSPDGCFPAEVSLTWASGRPDGSVAGPVISTSGGVACARRWRRSSRPTSVI